MRLYIYTSYNSFHTEYIHTFVHLQDGEQNVLLEMKATNKQAEP